MTKALVVLAVVAAALLAPAIADCPGACSGHGDCTTNYDFCKCYTGWMGNDCSQQLCPFGLSFIDTPNGDIDNDNLLSSGGMDSTHKSTYASHTLNPMFRPFGYWERHPSQQYGDNAETTELFNVKANEGHFYAECSNRGICDRSTGQCGCFTGYEGAGCNRTVCVNSCSGHGICQTINDMTPDGLYYRLWDADKTQVCKCDGGYFGVDCSQRKCMRNNDPLTLQTSRKEYSSGLPEAGEVQLVDIRCPYGGAILGPAYFTLTYTDVQFGDKYETPKLDILTATNTDIRNALRELPNQVLASYDGTFDKVVSVTKTTVDAANFYRLEVSFASHLGDVPLLTGTPYFKCQGGAEMRSDFENVAVTYDGDGPAYDIEFRFSAFTASAATVGVYNSSGVNLIANPAMLTFTTGYDSVPADLSRQAEKVNFKFGLLAGDRTGLAAYSIYIHTVPEITVKNQMFTFAAGAHDILGVDSPTATSISGMVCRLTTVAASVTPLIDREVKLTGISATLGRLTVNGEIVGLVEIPVTVGAVSNLNAKVLQLADVGSFDRVVDSELNTYLSAAGIYCTGTVAAADENWFFYPKTPFSEYSSGIDVVVPTFLNNRAPRFPLAVVLQITQINDATDEFRWKLAGDTKWSDSTWNSLSGATGYWTGSGSHAVPAAGVATALPNYASYSAAYPDDLMRLDVQYLLLDWVEGPDNQLRLCNTDGATYYLQVGSQGLNDSPECSDRGVCDYSTGICKCFKGYAGIDCTTQNALAGGGSVQAA